MIASTFQHFIADIMGTALLRDEDYLKILFLFFFFLGGRRFFVAGHVLQNLSARRP